MSSHHSKQRQDSSQAALRPWADCGGQAALEAALAAPLIVIFFLGLVDIGNMLTTYMSLTQAVREGARTGSGVATLETGTYPVSPGQSYIPDDPLCDSNPSKATTPCGHLLIQKRILTLLNIQGVKLDNVKIQTEYDPAPTDGSTAQVNDDTVRVRLTGNYRSYFSLYQGFPIRVEARAPFLFQPNG